MAKYVILQYLSLTKTTNKQEDLDIYFFLCTFDFYGEHCLA